MDAEHLSAFIPEAPTLDRPRDDSDLVLFALLMLVVKWVYLAWARLELQRSYFSLLQPNAAAGRAAWHGQASAANWREIGIRPPVGT